MPALSASYNVNSAGADTSTLTTPSIALSVGDVIVVKGVTWDSPDVMSTPTDTQGNTYTQRVLSATGGFPWAAIWTTIVASATPMTVSVGVPDACQHSMVVERWASAALDVTPAVNGTKTGTGSPLSTITTSQTASAVTWCNGDFPGATPVGRTYDTTSAAPIEDGFHDKSAAGAYVAYYAYQQAASAGSQTIGITAPTGQTWTLVAMEVLNVEAGVDPEQAYIGPLAWQ